MIQTFESGGGMQPSGAPNTGGNSSKVLQWILIAAVVGGVAWWGYNNFIKKPKVEEQK